MLRPELPLALEVSVMPLYEVTIGFTVEAYAADYVEAKSAEEAAKIALERYRAGDWNAAEVSWDTAVDDRVVCILDQAGNVTEYD
jgi:hypothetical protein